LTVRKTTTVASFGTQQDLHRDDDDDDDDDDNDDDDDDDAQTSEVVDWHVAGLRTRQHLRDDMAFFGGGGGVNNG